MPFLCETMKSMNNSALVVRREEDETWEEFKQTRVQRSRKEGSLVMFGSREREGAGGGNLELWIING